MGATCEQDMDEPDIMLIEFGPREEKEETTGEGWIPTFVPTKKMMCSPPSRSEGERWVAEERRGRVTERKRKRRGILVFLIK